MTSQTDSPHKIGWTTAAAVVIANMIGSGIFVSLGYQLKETPNSYSILILWIAGAIMALCGAFSYAELGVHLTRSGGEYHFLSKLYHPLLGYLSGWISITIGFAAPIALSAMAMGEYLQGYFLIPGKVIAILCLTTISLIHCFNIRVSDRFQILTTALKLLLILILITAGIVITPELSCFDWSNDWKKQITTSSFAVSFVFVTFSYSGWNAATYIIDEIRSPKKNLPKSLIIGTFAVCILYLLLNMIFLRQASLSQLQGQLEIGQIVAIEMFGPSGGMFISMAIAAMLVSGISAMIWTGSRVTQVMGEDYKIWSPFARKTPRQIPLRAIILQTGIALVLILTGSFENVLIYSGFVLQLFSALTVAGVIVLRQIKSKKPYINSSGKNSQALNYKSPLYPYPQILFLVMSIWVLIYLLIAHPVESTLGLACVALGAITWRIG